MIITNGVHCLPKEPRKEDKELKRKQSEEKLFQAEVKSALTKS